MTNQEMTHQTAVQEFPSTTSNQTAVQEFPITTTEQTTIQEYQNTKTVPLSTLKDCTTSEMQNSNSTTERSAKKTPLIGFSFSPGGLLFPYHLGVIDILSQEGYIDESTPLVGSSAGAIAITAFASHISMQEALDCCTRITTRCHTETSIFWQPKGMANGRLLKLLEEEMRAVLPLDCHETLNARPGMVGLAYREIFPRNRSILHTRFSSKQDVIDAVCNSSMFPFFTSNMPFGVRPALAEEKLNEFNSQSSSSGLEVIEDADFHKNLSASAQAVDTPKTCLPEKDIQTIAAEKIPTPTQTAENSTPTTSPINLFQSLRRSFSNLRNNASTTSTMSSTSQPNLLTEINLQFQTFKDSLPRVVVDGYFSTSRERFGCPAFPPEANVDRTITVSCFPHTAVGLTASLEHDQISPSSTKYNNVVRHLQDLLTKAAVPAKSAEEHMHLFQEGRADGQRWIDQERQRQT